MKNFKTIILSNQEISPGYYRMKILAPGYTKLAKPGQFVMFRVQRSLPPLLRRPFGIFRAGFMPADCDSMPPKEFIELIYKVVGSGTEIMQRLHQGDPVELLGPMGEGFDLGAPDQEKILVGGGIGLVPLYMLEVISSLASFQNTFSSPYTGGIKINNLSYMSKVMNNRKLYKS